MRLFQIHNGKGLDLTVSPDRNGDITRLRYKGMNMSYLSPSGYVAPAYYDSLGTNWLNSFTAGFLTTCGLNNVGTPNTDRGEVLPLHGSNREIRVSTENNEFCIKDVIANTGDKTEPYEILYHMNMGYPLLDEDSVIEIPSVKVTPRNDRAAKEIARWMHMQKPTAGYEECCYYHKFEDKAGRAKIYQPKLGCSLEITFDAEKLDGFVEWKMMGVRDYVLGLECGNCYPDGRDVMRKEGMLKFLSPGQSQEYEVHIRLRDE